MVICKVYGSNFKLINLVRNELTVNRNQTVKSIYNKARILLNDIDFDIIEVSDLVYHLLD